MGYVDKDIREKDRIEERPHGLVMTIEVYASYDGAVSVNDWPLINRGDEFATWSNAHVFVGAHLVNLARELAPAAAGSGLIPSGPRTPGGLPATNDPFRCCGLPLRCHVVAAGRSARCGSGRSRAA
jgi:hypothetical protein